MVDKDIQDYEKRLELMLSEFDKADLETFYNRRIAQKMIFDYYMLLLLAVGDSVLDDSRAALIPKGLSTRWERLKPMLAEVANPGDWDEAIKEVGIIRNKTSHNDDYSPQKEKLERLRSSAPKFRKWILQAGLEYYKQSHNVTFAEAFALYTRVYVRRADSVLGRYRKGGWLSAQRDTPSGEQYYHHIKKLNEGLKKRLERFKLAEEITEDDLARLIEIVREVERLDAREWAYIDHNICPKCGNDIVETQNPSGRSLDDPAPTQIVWRVGCSQCDYEIVSDVIDL